jgi:hypothetical protein
VEIPSAVKPNKRTSSCNRVSSRVAIQVMTINRSSRLSVPRRTRRQAPGSRCALLRSHAGTLGSPASMVATPLSVFARAAGSAGPYLPHRMIDHAKANAPTERGR